RDIQELLLGTGLGKSGMAVVGQGEIDAILSADPTQRRLLIEETAGVSRYTAQRRLAEQRLHRAGQDLARVIDLSAELSARAEARRGRGAGRGGGGGGRAARQGAGRGGGGAARAGGRGGRAGGARRRAGRGRGRGAARGRAGGAAAPVECRPQRKGPRRCGGV